MVAEETALQVHTRAQTRAVEAFQTVDEPTSVNPLDDQTKKSVEMPNEPAVTLSSTHGSTSPADKIALHDAH